MSSVAASAGKLSKSSPSLFPPEERFWKRYSPHYEMPLAGMTSLLLHGLALAFLILGGLAFFLSGREEAARPVSMDTAMMVDGGTGGVGGEEGLSGTPGGAGGKTEVQGPDQTEQAPALTEASKVPELQIEATPKFELTTLPDVPAKPANDLDDLTSRLQQIEKKTQAEDQAKAAAAAQKQAQAAASMAKRTSDGKSGTGGQGTYGSGPGAGKKGTGRGDGGIPGRKATDAEILAWRWNYDLSGDARQHAEKLANSGFVVAFPDGKGNLMIVQDLRRRPVELRSESDAKYKDAVMKQNRLADSVVPLGRELQLPFVPESAIVLIPEALRQKMANEETRFAKQIRRELRTVNKTWFDFRLLGGRYEPIVIRME
jgi:hypothetical protein